MGGQGGHGRGESGGEGESRRRTRGKKEGGEGDSPAPSEVVSEEQEVSPTSEVLSPEEFAKLETLKKYYSQTAMELCQSLDEDKNKEITREEVEKQTPEMVPFFDSWDTNGNGKLTRTEFVIGFCSCRINYQKMVASKEAADAEKAEAEAASPGGMKEMIEKNPEEVFALLDVNKDGKLTEDEAPEEKAELFRNVLTRLDADKDKTVTKEEFLKGMKELKKTIGHNASASSASGQGGGPPPPPR